MDDFSTVNWLAVIVGAAVSFLAGWLWYSPMLFGTKWAEGSRIAMGTADEMPKLAMAMQALALLLISTFIGLTAATGALTAAIVAILGIAAFNISAGAFIKKSNYALLTDGGYAILIGVIMIAVQAIL
ncbi:DUF1761 family protein [Ahrensia kielensis]|uniref:DUF1761 family protein n=1 Tax=Ahrensia kielensis TaxID=76980 RepID=A0ABU9T7N8_9HYPH